MSLLLGLYNIIFCFYIGFMNQPGDMIAEMIHDTLFIVGCPRHFPISRWSKLMHIPTLISCPEQASKMEI